MYEKDIEKTLAREAKKRGGIAYKFVSPGTAGVPDRIILLSHGRVGFAEMKAPGEKMRALQEKRKRQLEQLGFLVFCIDSKDQIEEVLDEIQSA